MPDGDGGEAVRPFLRLTGVRKTFPGVVALAGFDMTVAPGEVIGIVTAILNPSGERTFAGIGFAVPIENAAKGVIGESPL